MIWQRTKVKMGKEPELILDEDPIPLLLTLEVPDYGNPEPDLHHLIQVHPVLHRLVLAPLREDVSLHSLPLLFLSQCPAILHTKSMEPRRDAFAILIVVENNPIV